MKMKYFILLGLLFLCFISCDMEGGLYLPSKNEIIKEAEKAGANNVVINSYKYSERSWDNPSINTNGGFKSTGIYNIEVRVIYSGSASNTAVESAIRQLFLNNKFSSYEVDVYANSTSLPQQPDNAETFTMPSHQNIIEAVQNFGATSVTIATYTSNGNNVAAAGGSARSNAAIVIRVNYSYNGLGTVIPSQAAVTLTIRELFTGFTNITASVSATVLYPLPSHASIIAITGEQGAVNIKILEYTASNEVIDEFYYGSKQSNIPIKISITYDVGANVTLVEQAVRGLFQHFTNVTITTMLKPPTREEIISELNKEGAESVNIIKYTIAGSNSSEGYKAKNVSIVLEVYYTTLSESSNGKAAVINLFNGFTNTNIFVGNNIPISLPTQSDIINNIYSNTQLIASVNSYTVNGINASVLSSATSSDDIIIRIRAETYVSTGLGWGQGYWQAISNNSSIANDARGIINKLFIANGFNVNKISIFFE